MAEIPSPGTVTFRDVFAVGEFRALFAAQLVSVAGDQLARVALSILVFDRTGSPGWAALTYALTFLPDLLGGPLLAGLADRHPRRTVMVAADGARLLLMAVMALPGTPLPLLGVLLVGVQLLAAPWGAARAALLPQVLPGERFVVGTAVFTMTTQLAQVLGFATGGAIVAGLGPQGALGVNAVSFAVSALLVRYGIGHRPPPGCPGGNTATPGTWCAQVRSGLVLVWADRRLRALVALACVSGFYIAGEAVAAPYAAAIGGGSMAVGALLAAYAVGNVLGMAVLARLPARWRTRLLVPLAILACAALILCATGPGLAWTMVVWVCSGAASAYNLTASTLFVQAVPDARRGQAFGLAVTALRVSQGLGVVLAGVAAERIPPHQVVALAGVLGTAAAAAAGWSWRRSESPVAGSPQYRGDPAEAG
ncbi:MFS transporter [Amycolatopsis nigrescens]|uniref:MFS transporter n=1 Tax=Amycolatopsis nigrescens TaxID=381445 RepID=UPI00037D94B7|nr:MFS transporter [Amycolatopsis nigrescens]